MNPLQSNQRYPNVTHSERHTVQTAKRMWIEKWTACIPFHSVCYGKPTTKHHSGSSSVSIQFTFINNDFIYFKIQRWSYTRQRIKIIQFWNIFGLQNPSYDCRTLTITSASLKMHPLKTPFSFVHFTVFLNWCHWVWMMTVKVTAFPRY